jgi:hypothetical protein
MSTNLVVEIISSLRSRYSSLNELRYEGAWTESWCHRRCWHRHKTLLEAGQCVKPQGAGWYVLAVEGGTAGELTAEEDAVVDGFRFGHE